VGKFIILGFLIRLFFAVVQVIWPDALGILSQNKDALQFHEAAIEQLKESEIREFTIGHIYSTWLSFVYWASIESQLIGSIFSCSAWAASAYLLGKILKKTGTTKRRIEVSSLVYAMWPASIVFCSTTLREAYQILFVNLAAYGFILIVKEQRKISGCMCVYFATAGMSILHGALIVAGGYLSLVGTLFAFRLQSLKYFILILSAVIGYYLVSMNLNGGLIDQMIKYQENLILIEARANYREHVEIHSFIELVCFSVVAAIQYALEPFPWRLNSMLDILIALSNLFEIFILYRVSVFVCTCSGLLKKEDYFLIRSYLELSVVMLVIWGAGSANWGTAVRHHIVNFGVLIIMFQMTGKCLYTIRGPFRNDRA